MTGNRFDLDEACAVLERTPGTLATLLGGLPGAWLDADEGADTFSPRGVVAHLCDGERQDWIPRARIILEQGTERTFEPFDPLAFRAWSADSTVEDLVAKFATLRAANLTALREMELGPADFERAGTHPTFGRVTLGQLLATWVTHDLSHLAQIGRIMARRYTADVGPWRAFLPILKR